MLERLRVGVGDDFGHARHVSFPLAGQDQALQVGLGEGKDRAGLRVKVRAKRRAELLEATGQRSQGDSVMVGRFGVCLVGRASVVHRSDQSLPNRLTPGKPGLLTRRSRNQEVGADWAIWKRPLPLRLPSRVH